MTFVIAAVLAALAFSALRAASGRPSSKAGKRAAQPAVRWWWALGIAAVALVSLRFGLHWLAVVGGALLALLRTLGPLLPLLGRVVQSRQAGSGSHGAGNAHAPPLRPSRMTRQQALEVLGLDASASREDVQREYRRLMKRLHPDLGGSSYLAAQINAAKDALL